VGDASYLIINDAHPYTIEIESREPVETFCVFFARGFVESARQVDGPDEILLDHPEPREITPFREVLQSREGPVGEALCDLRRVVRSPRAGAVIDDEDVLVRLALALAAEQKQTARFQARVKAVKGSTRDEILRRLCIARDVLDGGLDERLRLDELARRSHLSPFHLHRHFRRVFGETPQAYRTRRRLDRAASTLRSTTTRVTDIALEAGFASLGSFSALFKRRFGVSPAGYRLQKEQD
jgi:AraC-like DNA-binding protein